MCTEGDGYEMSRRLGVGDEKESMFGKEELMTQNQMSILEEVTYKRNVGSTREQYREMR